MEARKRQAGTPSASSPQEQMEAGTSSGGAQRAGAAPAPLLLHQRSTAEAGYAWLFVPSLAILTTLLLSSLYVLRIEQAQVLGHERTIRELKSQIKALRQEVLSAKSVGQCSSGSVTKIQDEVHKLERTADTLRAGKQEAEKQLQEMISRVSLLQTERNKLKAALRAMRLELNDGGDDAQGSGSSSSATQRLKTS